jgi:hypothetical protein
MRPNRRCPSGAAERTVRDIDVFKAKPVPPVSSRYRQAR